MLNNFLGVIIFNMSAISAAIVSAETVGLIVITIIGIAILNDEDKMKSSRYFFCSILCTMIILISDILNYTLEGISRFNILLTITNFSPFLFGDILMIFYVLYFYSYVSSKRHTTKFFLYIIFAICAIDVVAEIVLSIKGLTYVVENGSFSIGPLYDVSFWVQLFVLFVCFIYLIFEARTIGVRSLRIFFLYYIFPTIAVIIMLINNKLSFISTSLSISFLIIYIGIEKRQRETIMTDLIISDTLTGLLNRNAYEESIEKMMVTNTEEKISVLFADLNGLKFANDNYGHAAGDELIKKFARILKGAFNENEIYRISGDEFVVISPNLDEQEHEARMKKFKIHNLDNDEICSFGYSYGNINSVVQLIKTAENMMYLEKERYYQDSKRDRRK